MPLTVIQEKYQLWLGTPRAVRPKAYRTEELFAEAFDVPVRTLRMWEGLPGWWDGVFSAARSVVGHELVDILLAMVKRAKAGSVPAAKLCLQTLDVHADKLRVEGEILGEQLVLILHQKEEEEDDA